MTAVMADLVTTALTQAEINIIKQENDESVLVAVVMFRHHQHSFNSTSVPSQAVLSSC